MDNDTKNPTDAELIAEIDAFSDKHMSLIVKNTIYFIENIFKTDHIVMNPLTTMWVLTSSLIMFYLTEKYGDNILERVATLEFPKTQTSEFSFSETDEKWFDGLFNESK